MTASTMTSTMTTSTMKTSLRKTLILVFVMFGVVSGRLVDDSEMEVETSTMSAPDAEHCKNYLYPPELLSAPMEFTKETSYEEYALKGEFKGLHCCARGYRSIEWLKDDKPYPWPRESVSGFILSPASANQTVYTHGVDVEDSGNYTCLLRNDTHVYSHTIQLRVYDRIPDEPQITYLSKHVEVEKGNPARLFCEAFIGQTDLPDARNDAVWLRLDENGTMQLLDERVHHFQITREDDQIFGSYMIIDEIGDDDYGQYICKISKAGGRTYLHTVELIERVPVIYLDPNPVPWRKLLTIICIILLALATVSAIYARYGLKLRVHIKDRFGDEQLSESPKTKDALIVYSEMDSELVLGVLLTTLESTYGYTCSSKELPSPSETFISWYSSLIEPSRKCRRIILVLSPSAVGKANWDAATLQKALKQITMLNVPVICVPLKELPAASSQSKNSTGETLASVLKQMNVIPWICGDGNRTDQNFWLSLRLRLPSKRVLTGRYEHGKGTIVRQTSDNNMMVDLYNTGDISPVPENKVSGDKAVMDVMV